MWFWHWTKEFSTFLLCSLVPRAPGTPASLPLSGPFLLSHLLPPVLFFRHPTWSLQTYSWSLFTNHFKFYWLVFPLQGSSEELLSLYFRHPLYLSTLLSARRLTHLSWWGVRGTPWLTTLSLGKSLGENHTASDFQKLPDQEAAWESFSRTECRIELRVNPAAPCCFGLLC